MTYLRRLVTRALLGDGSEPWADRVFDTAAIQPDTELPWITGGQMPWVQVRMGPIGVVGERARSTTFQVWAVGPDAAWTAIDNLEDHVVRRLDQTILHTVAGDPETDGYRIAYDGSPLGDQLVEAWDGYTRPLQFTAARLAWFGPDDPRAAWLRGQMPGLLCDGPDCVQTDPATWEPTDECPAIYWRPDVGPSEVQRYLSITLYREVLAGHIVTLTKAGQDYWTDRVALSLPGDALYVQPDEIDGGSGEKPRRSTILMRLLSTNFLAEPVSDGQLRVEVIFSELACGLPDRSPPLLAATARLPEDVAVSVPPLENPPLGRRRP